MMQVMHCGYFQMSHNESRRIQLKEERKKRQEGKKSISTLDTTEGCLNWLLDQATFTRDNNGDAIEW